MYSCNPSVNSWVKKNIQNIENITYDELVTYKLEYQKGIFQAASPDLKYNFWMEKFSRILDLEWSEAEIEYISSLKNTIEPNWYEDDIDPNLYNNIDIFLKEWKSNGLANLNLSIEMLHAIAGRIDYEIDPEYPNKLMATNYSTYGDGVLNGGNTSYTPDCGCSQNDDWCASIQKCTPAECEESSHGCGTIWVKKCNGRCQ